MKISRDSIFAIGLILILAVVTALAALQEANKNNRFPVLSSASNQPDGSRALFLWLDSLGYTTSNEPPDLFAIPENTDLVMILEPSEPIDEGQRTSINEWVSSGGTLLVAGEGWWTEDFASSYGYGFGYVFTETSQISPVSPVFSKPASTQGVEQPIRRVLIYTEPEQTPDASETLKNKPTSIGLPILWTADGLVAVSIEQDKGRIILISAPSMLTNLGLKTEGSAELFLNVLNLIQGPEAKPGRVWVDEWHHGLRSEFQEIIGPEAWLRKTPVGHALLFSAALIFIALLLSGRSFGKPLPVSTSQIRRAPLEYITALANLSRRAGHRGRILLAEYQTIRKYYEHRYHITQEMGDDEFTRTISRFDPGVDQDALLRLLHDLYQAAHSSKTSEADMLRLINEAHRWVNHNKLQNNPAA